MMNNKINKIINNKTNKMKILKTRIKIKTIMKSKRYSMHNTNNKSRKLINLSNPKIFKMYNRNRNKGLKLIKIKIIYLKTIKLNNPKNYLNNKNNRAAT